jgi:hypothetical protein
VVTTRLVELTETEVKSILMHYQGPEIAGLQPTDMERSLCQKMVAVLASFLAERRLSPEEWKLIRDLRARRERGEG